MKISEVIRDLQKIQKEDGDLDVLIDGLAANVRIVAIYMGRIEIDPQSEESKLGSEEWGNTKSLPVAIIEAIKGTEHFVKGG